MTDPFSIQLQLNQPGSATHPDLKVKSNDPCTTFYKNNKNTHFKSLWVIDV